MLFRAPVVVLAALLAQSALAADTSCSAGKYLKKNMIGPNYTCTTCSDGQYTPSTNSLYSCYKCPAGQTSNGSHTGCVTCSAGKYSEEGGTCDTCTGGTVNAAHTECTPCPAGQVSPSGLSCTPCPAGQGPNSGRTSCTACTGENYSTGGTNCMTCPAGTDANPSHTGCDKCPKGWYNPTAGSVCQKCPAGKFNNVLGAKSCCDCCAGWYSSSSGSTSCTKCPAESPYSSVGSNEFGDCKNSKGPRPNPTTSCGMVSDNVCPNTTGDGPQGTAITRKRQMQCTKGFTSCPRFSGRGGFDCVDTENDPEACGGCVGLDGEGSGTDCTAIQGTSATSCVKGSCVIDSCRKGWVKSLDGTSCVLASRATGSPASDGLHAQDAKKTKRSSGKRAIRHNIF